MKRINKERLKDIIIDHIYNRCYNDVVKIIEAEIGDAPLAESATSEDDLFLRKIHDNLIRPSVSVRMFHDIRNATKCRITVGELIESSFAEQLQELGYKKGKELNDQVFDALNYLVNRSFLVRNLPVISEYALTPKGLNHYSSGRSFEDLYLKEKKSRIALVVSIVSILIALGAIALNIINTSPAIL
jgi:hypothetical protein